MKKFKFAISGAIFSLVAPTIFMTSCSSKIQSAPAYPLAKKAKKLSDIEYIASNWEAKKFQAKISQLKIGDKIRPEHLGVKLPKFFFNYDVAFKIDKKLNLTNSILTVKAIFNFDHQEITKNVHIKYFKEDK